MLTGQPGSAIHIFESGPIRPIRPIGQTECPNLGSGGQLLDSAKPDLDRSAEDSRLHSGAKLTNGTNAAGFCTQTVCLQRCIGVLTIAHVGLKGGGAGFRFNDVCLC